MGMQGYDGQQQYTVKFVTIVWHAIQIEAYWNHGSISPNSMELIIMNYCSSA